MTEATEKTRWQISDLPSFYCTRQENQKTFRNLKPTVPYQTLLSGSRQNVIWSAQRKSVPKSFNLVLKKTNLALHEMSFVSCFVLCTNLRTHLILLISWIPWISTNAGKYVYIQISYVSQHAFLCHVFYADLSPSFSSLFWYRVVTLS